MAVQSYEDGLRAGEIESLRIMAAHHKDRLDSHEKRFNWHETRLRILERVAWIVVGAYGLAIALPAIKNLLGG
jgi:hypothetical protein